MVEERLQSRKESQTAGWAKEVYEDGRRQAISEEMEQRGQVMMVVKENEREKSKD